jgi:hypothetical protein
MVVAKKVARKIMMVISILTNKDFVGGVEEKRLCFKFDLEVGRQSYSEVA